MKFATYSTNTVKLKGVKMKISELIEKTNLVGVKIKLTDTSFIFCPSTEFLLNKIKTGKQKDYEVESFSFEKINDDTTILRITVKKEVD